MEIFQRNDSRNSARLTLTALGIPLLFFADGKIAQLLEYYFRFSKKYHYIYSDGTDIILIAQMFLTLGSLLFSINLLIKWREYNTRTKVFSLIIGSSVFLYMSYAVFYPIG
jgi:hypothetical protein